MHNQVPVHVLQLIFKPTNMWKTIWSAKEALRHDASDARRRAQCAMSLGQSILDSEFIKVRKSAQ
jgi:hypothetical protein